VKGWLKFLPTMAPSIVLLTIVPEEALTWSNLIAVVGLPSLPFA